MTKQELLDEGYGLWYIVLEHTNHRAANAAGEPWIYDDIDAAHVKADLINTNSKLLGWDEDAEYAAMMIKDFNLRYKKHMPEGPRGFDEVLRGTPRVFQPRTR